VRLQTREGGRISAVALHDCETTLARLDGMELHQQDWGDMRIPLRAVCEVRRSIGITLECAFADVERQVGISAVGCEFHPAA